MAAAQNILPAFGSGRKGSFLLTVTKDVLTFQSGIHLGGWRERGESQQHPISMHRYTLSSCLASKDPLIGIENMKNKKLNMD
ncbi:hypothetical protein NQZ68_001896 [Dissostichus eleginoides]|nr:hypothetical protein NQZ68_001896 [Dissostichus eleginoides]